VLRTRRFRDRLKLQKKQSAPRLPPKLSISICVRTPCFGAQPRRASRSAASVFFRLDHLIAHLRKPRTWLPLTFPASFLLALNWKAPVAAPREDAVAPAIHAAAAATSEAADSGEAAVGPDFFAAKQLVVPVPIRVSSGGSGASSSAQRSWFERPAGDRHARLEGHAFMVWLLLRKISLSIRGSHAACARAASASFARDGTRPFGVRESLRQYNFQESFPKPVHARAHLCQLLASTSAFFFNLVAQRQLKLGFEALTLERIHLPGDFVKNIVDAGQISRDCSSRASASRFLF